MKRLLCLAALSMLALLILAPAALAQSGEPSGPNETITCADFEDQGQAQEALNRVLSGDPAAQAADLDEDGDGIACEELPTATDPNELAPGVTQPCPFQLDRFPAGTVCGEGGAYIDPEDGTAAEPLPVGENPEEDEGDNVDPDTGEVVGDDTPDCESPEDVLESGLCRPSDEESADEDTPSVGTGDEGEGEKTRRERRERTRGEETGEDTQGPADEGGETPGSDEGGGSGEGGSGGGGNGSAGNNDGGGASQGGVSGAVNDGFGSILSGRLPNTGGGYAVLLVAGAVLIGGGAFLVRRFSSSA